MADCLITAALSFGKGHRSRWTGTGEKRLLEASQGKVVESNPIDHKWTFLSLRKEHHRLPRYVKTPLAATLQRIVGQRNRT